MRRFKVSLQAGINQTLSIDGSFFRVITSADEFQVQPDTGHRLAGLQSGMAYDHKKQFKTLDLLSDVNQVIELMAGSGRVEDNRTSISGIVDVSGKGATINNAAVTVGTVAAVLLAANADRRSMIILNNSANDIYIGSDATVTTANGLKIAAGQTITIDKAPQAAIYAIGSAAGLDVRTLEELS